MFVYNLPHKYAEHSQVHFTCNRDLSVAKTNSQSCVHKIKRKLVQQKQRETAFTTTVRMVGVEDKCSSEQENREL